MQKNAVVAMHISLTLCTVTLCIFNVHLQRTVYCRWKVLMSQLHKAGVTVLCFGELMSSQN